jgi:hypothetical protein
LNFAIAPSRRWNGITYVEKKDIRMLYVDLPTRPEFLALREKRADACVSIYVETTPLSQHVDASRTQMANLFKTGREQLEAAGFDKRRMATLTELIDDEFWRLQANSLAVFATPDTLQTFRLANRLSPMVRVSDRLHLNPLLRAITFPHVAYVLAASENAVRLIEVLPDLAPSQVKVPGLPRDAASAVGKSTLNDRGPSGRIHGTEGQNVRLRQYVRQIDAALRPILAGRDTPLILAAADRLASIYRSVNSYPNLLADHIASATDRTTDAELGDAARAILDQANAQEIAKLRALYEQRAGMNRATTDLSDASRAASHGAIETLLVDIGSDVPGLVDETTGAVSFAEGPSALTYDVVDEVAARALSTGARVLGVRKADLPGDGVLAAILRFAA